MKTLKRILAVLAIIYCLGVVVWAIVSWAKTFVFRERYDKPYIEQFEQFKKKNIIMATIYRESDRYGEQYKLIIKDNGVINELLEASTFDYGTKIYSGQYNQHYSILLEAKDGTTYMYGFNKTFSPKGEYCRKSIEYKGKRYPNPYNDCGQIYICDDPSISEDTIINNPLPSAKVAGYNLKLIGFIQKYADNVPFDGKNKVPYYNHYDLEKMNGKPKE